MVYQPAPPKPQPNSTGNLWGWERDRAHEETLRASKRLTDAEVAAEMWRDYAANGDSENSFDERLEAWARVEVWHRFATHPHYDEGKQDD